MFRTSPPLFKEASEQIEEAKNASEHLNVLSDEPPRKKHKKEKKLDKTLLSNNGKRETSDGRSTIITSDPASTVGAIKNEVPKEVCEPLKLKMVFNKNKEDKTGQQQIKELISVIKDHKRRNHPNKTGTIIKYTRDPLFIFRRKALQAQEAQEGEEAQKGT